MEGGPQTLLIIREIFQILRIRRAPRRDAGAGLDKLPTKLRSERDRGVLVCVCVIKRGGGKRLSTESLDCVREGSKVAPCAWPRLHWTREGGCRCLSTLSLSLFSMVSFLGARPYLYKKF